jgi:probable addiction module antidote protein
VEKRRRSKRVLTLRNVTGRSFKMAKQQKRTKSRSYDSFLKKQLRDPDMAAEYLSTAVREGSLEGFLVALKSVAEAHGGIGTVAKVTNLNRQSMYRMFSERGNPTVSSLLTVLNALGIEISFTSQEKKSRVA